MDKKCSSFNYEQKGNLIFSNECHLFLVMIFHIRQEIFYALCIKLPKVKKVASDRQLRDFRKLFTHLTTSSGSHIELGRPFSVGALRAPSVAN